MLLNRILQTFMLSLTLALIFLLPWVSKNKMEVMFYVYPPAFLALILYIDDLKKIWSGHYDDK